MGKKRWISLLFLWIVLSIVGCWILYRYVANYNYNHPFLIAQDDTHVVVVDDNDRQTNILQLDTQNRITGKISYDRIENNRHHVAWKLFQAENGWYLMDLYNLIGGSDDHFDLYYLDFQQQEMVLLYQSLETMCNDQCSEQGIKIYVNHRMEITVDDDVIYLDLLGRTSENEFRDMRFRLKDGACELQQVREVPFVLLKDVLWGSVHISLYENIQGIYYEKQPLSKDFYSNLLVSQKGGIYAVNQTKDVVEQLLPKEKKLVVDPENTLNRLEEYDLSLRGIRALSMVNGENFAAAYYDLGLPRVLVEWNGQFHIYDSAQAMDTPMLVLWCALLTLALGILVLGGAFLIRYLWNHGSVVVKILSGMIPAMILLSGGSIWLVSALLTQYQRQQDQRTMEMIAQEVHSFGYHQTIEDFGTVLDSLKNTDPQADMQALKNYYEMFYNIQALSLQLYEEPVIWDEEAGMEFSNQYHCNIEYYGLDQKNNSYYCIYGPHSMIPLEQWMAPRELMFFNDTIEADTDEMFTHYSDNNQKFIGLILPSWLEDGTVNGFYLILGDRIEGNNQVKEIIRRFVFWQIMVCALLVVLLTPVIYFTLRPLGTLRRKANMLTQGALPTLDPPRKGVRNEITDLEDTFRQLVEQFGQSTQQLNHLQNLSRAYFSRQILALLDKKSVAQLTFQETTTQLLYIAYLRGSDRSFAGIQRLVEKLIGWLEGCDGFFASVTGEELVLVSRKPSLFYAAAAMAQEEDIHIAFDHTPVTVRVMGANEEYRFLVFPEDQNRKEALCVYRDGMNCRLLVTEGSFPLQEENWSFRKVGLLDRQGLMECFLDSSANQYRMGQEDLERGVEQFFREEYVLARNSFVQALRRYPQDQAALYYIRLIDAGIGGQQKEENL